MITNISAPKKKIWLILVAVLLIGLYVFFAAPNLNPLYADGAIFWLVLITAFTVIMNISSFKLIHYTDDRGKPAIKFDKGQKINKSAIIIVVTLWALFILANIIFNPIFFWKSYRDQMVEPEAKKFTEEVAPIDLSQIPVVDKELARTLADKKLGEKPSLGSQVELGEPTIQSVDGKLIWAVPLRHSGFFKWISNMSGSAGYITVSATNLKDVKYIADYKIKIQPDSYFLHDLARKVRFSSGIFSGITDYSFELNDEGKPFWVVTTYKNTIGYSLPEANGVIIVDAQTGSSQKYTLDNIPKWVDRVQPEDYIMNQINNKGKYVHGIFNFSNKDKYKTSAGSNIVYNDGNCYLFTGITSVGVDESATGFIMVDMVTKQPILYRMSGATEHSAMQSAQGKVQDLGYTATMPLILNLYNEPTYFMTLKDSAKLIKKYAFVSVKDYMIVGVGDTMNEAKADYAKTMNDISDKPNLGKGEEKVQLEAIGTVDRINFTIKGDQTFYSFTMTEKPGVIFRANLTSSAKLPLTMKGDNIKIKYTVLDDTLMDVSEFNNLSM
ncbi:hypothetical protein RBG61_11435 [Paludicola sp. MB14-C6]|uniref:hypothetical protein n=1 Tax=Paludihabitans sp. MB14-C6 TaxID=3070656 RepID=UPI0027DC839C|nr:hypothetical protein [Paludicola sp. MB14-C6]WMJ22595.1 hypothetical protein RBG61_11435 [Paludicola sp. MB14-C6]